MAKFLGKYTRKAEALVCAAGMLLSTPFLFLALTVAQYRVLPVAWVSECVRGEFVVHCWLDDAWETCNVWDPVVNRVIGSNVITVIFDERDSLHNDRH